MDPATGDSSTRLSSWVWASVIAYFVVIAALVAALLAQGIAQGAVDSGSPLVWMLVVLTLPMSTAYYVVGAMGSSSGSLSSEIAIGALPLMSALYYLGFVTLALVNAGVFVGVRSITRQRQRRVHSGQSVS
jgi:hypothetical protein